MPGTVLITLPALPNLILTITYQSIIFIYILHIRTQKHIEVKQVAQDHTADNKQTWDIKLGNVASVSACTMQCRLLTQKGHINKSLKSSDLMTSALTYTCPWCPVFRTSPVSASLTPLSTLSCTPRLSHTKPLRPADMPANPQHPAT